MSIGRRRLRHRVDAVETQRTEAAGHSRLRCRSITHGIGVTAFTMSCTGSLPTLCVPPVRVARAMLAPTHSTGRRASRRSSHIRHHFHGFLGWSLLARELKPYAQ